MAKSFLDAALNGQASRDGKVYFFKGQEYVRWDWSADRADAGYPKSIAEWGFPSPFDAGIDAAVEGRRMYGKKAYFFKGDQYLRYDWISDKIDSGYPKSIDDWSFPKELLALERKIDAAVNGTGKYAAYCYFFNGAKCVRYDWGSDTFATVGTIAADWKLPARFASGVDAALSGWGPRREKAYFFKGEEYARYNWITIACDSGLAPASVRAWGLPFATSAPASPGPAVDSPPSPYDKLPAPLQAKLVRSYEDRKNGVPGAEKNLNAYYGRGANVWEMINQTMDWQDINSMVRVYQRMEAVDKTGALWRDHVKYLLRAYTGGVYALEMIYADRSALRAYLDGDLIKRTDVPMLAKGVVWTQCMHKNTDGWREVSSTDSLHINVAQNEAYDKAEDCHIDETSFTASRDAEGKSVQAWGSGPGHFLQSQLKWDDIERPFAKLEAMIKQPVRARPSMTTEAADAFDDWQRVRGAEAVSGEPGHQRAVALLHRMNVGSPEGPPPSYFGSGS
jgi:Hemopexin